MEDGNEGEHFQMQGEDAQGLSTRSPSFTLTPQMANLDPPRKNTPMGGTPALPLPVVIFGEEGVGAGSSALCKRIFVVLDK